jgi:glucose/mannose-6-phosphate isomerase
MLDDLKIIHKRDKSDALGIAEKQWQQLKHDFSKVAVDDIASITTIVVGGMGGSALAAKLAAQVYKLPKPFEIVQDYNLPPYVNADTLFIASSYSGNTEETLTALEQAQARGAAIAVITAGGQLAKIAQDKGYPLYKLPQGMQPRMAVFYNLAALTQLCTANGLLPPESVDELRDAADWLGTKVSSWLADVPVVKNDAKRLAQDCIGVSPVI